MLGAPKKIFPGLKKTKNIKNFSPALALPQGGGGGTKTRKGGLKIILDIWLVVRGCLRLIFRLEKNKKSRNN